MYILSTCGIFRGIIIPYNIYIYKDYIQLCLQHLNPYFTMVYRNHIDICQVQCSRFVLIQNENVLVLF